MERTGFRALALIVALAGGGETAVVADAVLAQYARCSPQEQHRLELPRIVTLPMTEAPVHPGRADGPRALGVRSLGVLPVPPERVLPVLRAVGESPDWVTLSPTYKRIEVGGGNRFTAAIGKSDRHKAHSRLPYRVESGSDHIRWVLLEAQRGLLAGSFLEFTWTPHPDGSGRTLLLHTQVAHVSPGRGLHYLRKPDDQGRPRGWKDARKHAKRLHWALAAHLMEASPIKKRARYVSDYRREFGGRTPFWARPR